MNYLITSHHLQEILDSNHRRNDVVTIGMMGDYIKKIVRECYNGYLEEYPSEDKISVLATDKLFKYAEEVFKNNGVIRSIDIKPAKISNYEEELAHSISFGRNRSYSKVTVSNTILEYIEDITTKDYELNMDKLPIPLDKDKINTQFDFILRTINNEIGIFYMSNCRIDMKDMNIVGSKKVIEYIKSFWEGILIQGDDIIEGPVILNDDLSEKNYLMIGNKRLKYTINITGTVEKEMVRLVNRKNYPDKYYDEEKVNFINEALENARVSYQAFDAIKIESTDENYNEICAVMGMNLEYVRSTKLLYTSQCKSNVCIIRSLINSDMSICVDFDKWEYRVLNNSQSTKEQPIEVTKLSDDTEWVNSEFDKHLKETIDYISSGSDIKLILNLSPKLFNIVLKSIIPYSKYISEIKQEYDEAWKDSFRSEISNNDGGSITSISEFESLPPLK